MSVRREFDAWAADGRDRSMEERHWHTAKDALALMPVESGDRVLDLGTGSGYAPRALRELADAGIAVGLDGAPEMARNARSYTDDPAVSFLTGDFHALPFRNEVFDHAFSMEAFYYAASPARALEEIRRVLRSGGTFYCAVNYFEESRYTHEWADRIDVEMTRWSAAEYREAFREAGFHVGGQTFLPDREIEIPPAEAFPTDEWETREAMIDRYRTWGTLLTIGVVP